MLTYQFNNKEPLYEQLYKYIRNDIMNGTLHPGDKLPSKRSLAKQLNISTITIETSYAQLVSEGFIDAIPRKGFYVTSLPVLASQSTPISKEIVVEQPVNPYIYNFSSNQTRSETFPFSIWAKLTRSLLTDHQDLLMTNSPTKGTWALREAIAKHLHDFQDLNVSPHQIVVGAGTEYLYGLLIQLLGFDRHYGLEWPGYQKIKQISQSHHVSIDMIMMDEAGILIDELNQHDIDVIHITPSHQYPTGITMPMKRRYELLQWAIDEDDRYIIEDDYDSEFSMAFKPMPSLFSIDQHHKVIYMNTFNKKLASTIRISYMVLPEPLVKQFNEQMDFYACSVSTFEQYTLARFLQDGYYEKHINRLRTRYRHQRDEVIAAIKRSPIADRVTITKQHSGLHFLLTIKSIKDDRAFLDALKKARFHLTGFEDYGLHNTHTFIINYTAIDLKTIDQALELMSQFVLDNG